MMYLRKRASPAGFKYAERVKSIQWAA
jgi:hypothetical protein